MWLRRRRRRNNENTRKRGERNWKRSQTGVDNLSGGGILTNEEGEKVKTRLDRTRVLLPKSHDTGYKR